MTKPEILELKGIDAKVELKDGQHVQIKAINGLYDTKSEVLKLHDEIVLTTTSAMRDGCRRRLWKPAPDISFRIARWR